MMNESLRKGSFEHMKIYCYSLLLDYIRDHVGQVYGTPCGDSYFCEDVSDEMRGDDGTLRFISVMNINMHSESAIN